MSIATPQHGTEKTAEPRTLQPRFGAAATGGSIDPGPFVDCLNELHANADRATRVFFERISQISPAAEIMRETSAQREVVVRLLVATASADRPGAGFGRSMIEADPALEAEAGHVGAALLWTLEEILEGFDRKARAAWESAYAAMMADLMAWALAVEEAAVEMTGAGAAHRPH